MDPNPKTFPVLSYVMSRLPQLSLKTSDSPMTSSSFDIEQPQLQNSQNLEFSADETPIVERMPRLIDPKVISSMTSAVSEVAQARSVIQTLGERPAHETVDIARVKIAEIDAKLSKDLEGIVLSPRPQEVERIEWRAKQAEKEQECRLEAEKEKQLYKAVVQLDEMHEGYEKFLRQAEDKLVRIYESSTVGGGESVDEKDQVNEEVVGILTAASGNGIERIDLSKRDLRFLPEAFGHLRGLVVLNLADNMLKTIPDSIAGLENLEELDLSSNVLESLPDSIGLLLKLKILSVSKNQLLCLPDTICHCRSLVELDASINYLTYLPTRIGCELVNLEKLSLQLNKIKHLPTSICEMKSLRHLTIYFNELHGLPLGIGKLTNLETLNVSGNFADLEELPFTIGELTNLTELDLGNNQIRVLPDSFGRLENLRKLNLDGNPILIPPKEVVDEGIEAVKSFMADRWVEALIEEDRKCLDEMREAEQTGWLTRSSSWLNNVVSGVSRSISTHLGSPGKKSPRKSPRDPSLDQLL